MNEKAEEAASATMMMAGRFGLFSFSFFLVLCVLVTVYTCVAELDWIGCDRTEQQAAVKLLLLLLSPCL